MKRQKMGLTFDQVVTKGGDSGQTSMYDGSREFKDNLVFDVLGELDMLNSMLGYWKSFPNLPKFMSAFATNIQRFAIQMSGQIAVNPNQNPEKYKSLNHVTSDHILDLEKDIQKAMKNIQIKPEFVLPEGMESSYTDILRCQVRRVERLIVSLVRVYRPDLVLVQNFLNRLSDYFFVLARSLK